MTKRLILTLLAAICIGQVQALSAEKIASNPLFIMISNCMRDDLQDAFASLVAANGSGLWIAPLHRDMELHVAETDSMEVVRWEVDHYEK